MGTSDFNPLNLSGKKFFISGAASGIGRATCILLSKLDADLIMADINLKGLEETAKECKPTDIISVMDFSQSGIIKERLGGLVASFGKLNGCVHIAGKPYISPLKSLNEKTALEVFQINTMTALELSKAFANRSISAEEGGSIVYISSVYALVGSSANVGYSMSKSALHGITKSLAVELSPRKIRVNCIAPGFIKTKMGDNISHFFAEGHDEKIGQMHPLGLGEPEDVANAIAFLLSDLSKWITGSIMNVDGGFTAI